MRLLSVRGEVRIKRYPQDSFATASAPVQLFRRDEIETRTGGAEIEVENGMIVELGEGTLVALIGRDSGVDAFFARGALRARPGKSGQVHSVHVMSGAGRLTLRGKDVRLRGDMNGISMQVFDGMASVWGKGGLVVRSGQMTQIEKGSPPQAPRPIPLLPSPLWQIEAMLALGGAAPPIVALKWQPTPMARRYRLEIARSDEAEKAPLVIETEAPRAELRDLAVGVYQARVVAIDDKGGRSEPSEPRRLIVAGVGGLSAGLVTLTEGGLPRVATPTGLSATLQVDGAPLGARGLAAGEHRLLVTIGGLSAEVSAQGLPALVAPSPRREPGHLGAAPRPHPALTGGLVREGPDTARSPFLVAPGAATQTHSASPQRAPFSAAPAPDRPPADMPPPEDVLLLGPSEVPAGGVRSPWAGRLVQLRLESTAEGAARLAIHGRATLRNGFGGEISFSLLRAQLGAPLPSGAGPTESYGNLSAALRSPALRRERLALQGVVAAVFPISASALDHALYEVPAGAAPVPLPSGGGWRLDTAVLLGIKLGRFSLITQQGISLRLTGGVLPAYEGGLLLQAAALRQLRLLGFCQYSVNYLGIALLPGEDTLESGAAVGGGLEILLPGPLGGARVALLGRTGIGSAGTAIYGRGSFGLQAGYFFR